MREQPRADGMRRESRDATHLRRLSELDDYRVADGDPDIRWWRVFDSTGVPVGQVHDLIADVGTLQVRYMDLQLDQDGPHVLVPIGLARLSEDADTVTLASATVRDLQMLPAYDHQPLTRDRECDLQGALLGLGRPAEDTGDAFYAHAMFDSRRLRASQEPDAARMYAFRRGPAEPPS